MEPPAEMLMSLLPFQKEFLAWAVSQERGEIRGGILADEMGMGKTIQVMSHQSTWMLERFLCAPWVLQLEGLLLLGLGIACNLYGSAPPNMDCTDCVTVHVQTVSQCMYIT